MNLATKIRQLNKETITTLLIWSAILALSLFWNFQREHEKVLQLALVEAQTNLKKDRAFRLWGVEMGGFYVKVQGNTLPSPYMAHIPERDVTTASGKELTLYSPAIAMRLIMETQEKLFGIKARITSEQYLNPINAPDEWETKSLKIIKKTNEDFNEITTLDGEVVLRYMQPMMMEQNCVKCHAWTGIKVGEMRGATDVAIPLAPYQLLEHQTRNNLIASHSGLWIVGLGFIGFFASRKKVFLKELYSRQQDLQDEITKRKETEVELEEIAYKDFLTGLPNRQLFYDRLENELIRAKRKDKCKFALLFIDLDDFKKVNDTVGHHIGDKLLKIAAKRLDSCIRESDTVARLGGDEFTIILTDIKSSKIALDIAKKIIDKISIPIHLQGNDHYVGASIGICIYPEDGDDKHILIRNADAAMYHAKESGKGKYKFFNEDINLRNQKRRLLEEDLRKALKNNEFELYYQPQINTRNEKIVAAEALIRWNHPTKNLVLPLEFIHIAEENGMIIDIGKWAFKQACNHIDKYRSLGRQSIPIAINLSVVQLAHEGLIEMVESTLKDKKIPGNLIELEITESAIMGNPDRAIEVIEQLTKMGIRISIDDFGTGYSSLAYLKKFTVDKLKIDREFIKDLPNDKEDAVLASTMIMLAKNLELDILAEGVENKEQIEFLRQRGCNTVQGYYYSKPLPEKEFIEFTSTM